MGHSDLSREECAHHSAGEIASLIPSDRRLQCAFRESRRHWYLEGKGVGAVRVPSYTGCGYKAAKRCGIAEPSFRALGRTRRIDRRILKEVFRLLRRLVVDQSHPEEEQPERAKH